MSDTWLNKAWSYTHAQTTNLILSVQTECQPGEQKFQVHYWLICPGFVIGFIAEGWSQIIQWTEINWEAFFSWFENIYL